MLAPLGYALGQMLATVPAAFKSESGVLGWLFILGHGGAAVIGALVLIACAALVSLSRLRGIR